VRAYNQAMKLSALVLAVLALAPSAVLAQASPPAPSHMMHGGMMGGDMQGMMKMHQALRLKMLQALTPANKQLLATVVGQLATADTPDVKAAAAQLDAALSDGEKQAILAAVKAAHDQMKQSWQSAHPNASPRPMHSPGATGGMHGMHGMHDEMSDPGALLLMIVAHGEPMPMMGGQHR